MSKKLKVWLWITLALAALAFLVYRTPKATFAQAIQGMDAKWVTGAIFFYLSAQTLLATRWVFLLRVHGVHISRFQAIKLTYLGLFYNNMMPGSVGGDLLKGWYITQHSGAHQRLEAATTVFVDRLIGLIGMVIVGALASLLIGPGLAYHGVQIRWLIWGLLGMMLLGSIVFFSRHIRRVLGISKLLDKLPFAQVLRQVDLAIRAYRTHVLTIVWALFLTAVIQGMSIVAIWMLTQSLKFDQVRFIQCLVIMPIVWTISAAIPVPGGLGVVENLVTYLFCLVINRQHPVEATGQAAALALLIRLLVCLCSMPGALVPILGGHLPKQSELTADLTKIDTFSLENHEKSGE